MMLTLIKIFKNQVFGNYLIYISLKLKKKQLLNYYFLILKLVNKGLKI